MADILLDYITRILGCDSNVTSNVTRNAMRNVTRNATVGALVTIWGVARRRGKRIGNDLVLCAVNHVIVDDIGDLQGIGEAMVSVGWLRESSDGLVFPNFFDEFNTAPLARGMSNAERQRAFRERKRQGICQAASRITDNADGVTDVTTRNGREEKRREENVGDESPTTPLAQSRKNGSEPTSPTVLTIPTSSKDSAEWPLTEAKVAEYSETFPGIDVLGECKKAAQWCRDNPSRRKTARGMTAFLFRWLERIQNSGRTANGPATPKNGPSPAFGGPKEGYGPPETTKAIIERLYAEKQKRENGGQ